MNTITDGLLARLEGFEIDEPGAALPFTARLARENGWTPARAGRVVREYKRFLFLSAAAGHPVTPSEDVDQAWHLHMVYTRSYWDRLCSGILGRPLHHDPTNGGTGEGAKFYDWYARTLESYRALIGEGPPPDIWPSPDKRFEAAGQGQWVDRSRFWFVRKPFRIPPVVINFAILLAIMVLAGLISLTGCVPGTVTLTSAMDSGGAASALFVAGLFAAVIAASLILKRKMAEFERPDAPVDLSEPYDIAMLAGGRRRVMQAALAKLVFCGALTYTGSNKRSRRLNLGDAAPDPPHPVESAILRHIRTRPGTGGASLRSLHGCAADELRAIEYRLAVVGLKPTAGDRHRAVCAMLKPLIAAGVIILVFGVLSDLQPGLLTLLLFLIVAFFVLRTRNKSLTPAGETLLDRLKGHWRAGADDHPVSADSLACSVALLGTPALLYLPGMEPLRSDLEHHGQRQISNSKRDNGGCGGCGNPGGGDGGCGGCGGCGS